MSRMPNYSSLGAGPVVLFLHGIGGGHLAFAPQLETFAQAGYRAVAWDMPGYGLSAPVEPYGVRGLAQSCERLIEALLPPDARGPERSVVLIGHGLGGMHLRGRAQDHGIEVLHRQRFIEVDGGVRDLGQRRGDVDQRTSHIREHLLLPLIGVRQGLAWIFHPIHDTHDLGAKHH